LGRIAPAGLLGGAMSLDPEAARGAMASKVGEALGLGPEGAALGAVALAVANVRRAVEAMTMARGRDPREFVLVAAGGAGPLIACELAAELGINEVIVPTAPGNFSAFGLVASDLRRDWVRTRITLACGERLPELAAEFRALEDKAQQWLTESLEPTARVTLLRRIAARYQGQDYELDVEVPSGQLSPVTLGQVIEAFHEAHQARYGYHLQTQPVEFVDVMVSAVGAVTRPHTAVPADGKQGGAAQTGARPVLADGQEQVEEWPVLDRARLSGGDGVAGPTIIEQYDSTIYLPRGCIARVVDGGCLRVATGGSRG
ncbi:MAG: hydantoinase/oxoprolinase family protein, partial [Armatimonadota bacterium]